MWEMLFKSLGLNPAEIKKQVEDAPAKFNELIAHFDERLNTIEKNQQKILSLLSGRSHENIITHKIPDSKFPN